MKELNSATICEVGDVYTCQFDDQYKYYVLGICDPGIFNVKKTFRRAIVGRVYQSKYVKWWGPDPEIVKRDLCLGIESNPGGSTCTGFYWMLEQPVLKGGINVQYFGGVKFENETLEEARGAYGNPLFVTTFSDNPKVLSELFESKPKEQITYSDLLETKQWQGKRLQILLRDEFKCRKCNKPGTTSTSNSKFVLGVMPILAPGGTIVGHYEDNLLPGLPAFGQEKIYLQVHHKKYFIGRWPWEYDDDDLISLCENCHQKVHEEETISYYDEKGARLKKESLTPCNRCDGKGYIPEYKHVQNGICFKCRGGRYEEVLKCLMKDSNY